MRSLAQILTGCKIIKVLYNEQADTSFIELENDKVVLSLKPYPDYVKLQPIIAQKMLDGDLGHECGHFLLTKPIWDYFSNWATKIKRLRGNVALAKEICNLVEDKRVNYFIISRHRFDIGARLELANLILKDTIENAISKGKNQIFMRNVQNLKLQNNEGSIMYSVLVNNGLYEADCSEVIKVLSPKAQEALKKALEVLENCKYQRVKMDIIHTCQDIYDLIVPFLPKNDEPQLRKLIPSRKGGEVQPEISQELKDKLEQMINEEIKRNQNENKDLNKDLKKGSGAGEGTGEDIPTPEPNFEHYDEILDRTKEEIARLLAKLKKYAKPRVNRQIFQSRGRFMNNLLAKAKVASYRQDVKNVYVNVNTTFEKEKVAIGFIFDYSGSVDWKQAEDITTILNEVFGNWVDDAGFAIGVFGATYQKIKTFFEQYANTRARIGAISVNSSGTKVAEIMASFLKMYANVSPDRRKILVLASDFDFYDETEAHDILKLYDKAGIELIFIGTNLLSIVGCFNSI
jgi:hypothetical protein